MPENPVDPGLARAGALLEVGRPDAALRELATLAAEVATSPLAFELRASALLELERWTEAADAARQGLVAGGPDADLLRQMAIAEHRLGRAEVAERAVLDGLAMRPSHVGLLCTYAELCWEALQFDKAERLVARAAEQQPHAPLVYAARIRLAYARGKDREAQRVAREFVGAYPELAAAHALLGGASGAQGQVRHAYDGLRQAAATEPTTTAYGKAAAEVRIENHPLLIPIRPFTRFGPARTWLVAVAILFTLRLLNLPYLALAAAFVWMAWCVYSWIVPPIVRRLLQRRWTRL